jgi:hypothetical protein
MARALLDRGGGFYVRAGRSSSKPPEMRRTRTPTGRALAA